MGYGALFLIGVGLSMDAFAASICKGLAMGRIRWRQGMVIALLFGGFQALMPLLGWALGRQERWSGTPSTTRGTAVRPDSISGRC